MTALPSLDLQPVVNAAGTLTSLGGCRLRPETIRAMARVAPEFIDYPSLLESAGERVAAVLGVESAQVVAGASAGLALSAAACIAGSSTAIRRQLPITPNPNEIVIPTSHRNPYDHALRIGGATLVEAGDAIAPDISTIEDSIGPSTVAVAYFLQASLLDASPRLEEVIEVSHRHGVPVIVDAAAELPPKKHLWTLVEAGADLVVFSGGKQIGGPPASGLVVGRQDLISSVAFQSVPHYGVGRPMKASKEAIVGFVAALEAYLQEDEEELLRSWEARRDTLAAALRSREVSAAQHQPTQPRVQPSLAPRLAVDLPDERTAEALRVALLKGNPPVAVDRLRERIILNVQTLLDEEVTLVADRLAVELKARAL